MLIVLSPFHDHVINEVKAELWQDDYHTSGHKAAMAIYGESLLTQATFDRMHCILHMLGFVINIGRRGSNARVRVTSQIWKGKGHVPLSKR